jgi:hypothetical protein
MQLISITKAFFLQFLEKLSTRAERNNLGEKIEQASVLGLH